KTRRPHPANTKSPPPNRKAMVSPGLFLAVSCRLQAVRLQVHPDRALLGALHGLHQEPDAAQAVMHRRIAARERLARLGAADVGDRATVDVREGLKVALGVPRRDARRRRGLRPHVAEARAPLLPRLARGLEDQRVGILLVPLETALAAVHADVEVVLLAAGDLRAHERALAAVLQAQQDVGVVLELAA